MEGVDFCLWDEAAAREPKHSAFLKTHRTTIGAADQFETKWDAASHTPRLPSFAHALAQDFPRIKRVSEGPGGRHGAAHVR